MKLGQFFKKAVGGSMILAALACPVFTSCYDDSKLWAEVGILKDKQKIERAIWIKNILTSVYYTIEIVLDVWNAKLAI